MHGKCVPTAISGVMDISEVPRCHEFSVRVTKITSRIGVSWTHSLATFLFLANLNLMNYGHIIESM